MVDALHGIRRVLQSGGMLVDLRPVSATCPIELRSGSQITLAAEADAFGMAADDGAADAAAREAVARGWFVPQRTFHFDIDFCWNAPQELVSYIETSTRMQGVRPSYDAVEAAFREAAEAAGGSVRLCCRRPFLLSTYTKS